LLPLIYLRHLRHACAIFGAFLRAILRRYAFDAMLLSPFAAAAAAGAAVYGTPAMLLFR